MTEKSSSLLQSLLEPNVVPVYSARIPTAIAHKVILITGAAGSIGQALVKQLLVFKPQALILIDQSEASLIEFVRTITPVLGTTKLHYFLTDIKDAVALENIFQQLQPQFVYHAAANKHVPLAEEDPYQAVSTNLKGTKNVALCAQKYGCEAFVFISTDKAVQPSSVMGATKRLAELYLKKMAQQNTRTKFVIIRFGNVFGSSGSVVPIFQEQIKKGLPVTITSATATRFFMSPAQACALIVEAGCMGNSGATYFFKMGQPIAIIALAEALIKAEGLVPYTEIPILFTGLRPGEKMAETLVEEGAIVLETAHAMICRIQENKAINLEFIFQEIELLLLALPTYTATQTVQHMKRILPDFKSQNSIYKALDL
uniref:SDR family NAD(P)-dependent oxidoreductase n=1 Tax=Flavobacterium sp. TaxID=239 RepID=UPI00404A5934